MLEKRITIKDALGKSVNSKVVVAGWVDQIKLLGKINFLSIIDRSGKVQVVSSDDSKLKNITPQSSVVITGKIKKSQKKDASKELELEDIEVLNVSETPLPVDMVKDTSNLDKRIDFRFLDTRKEKINAIFRIRSCLYKNIVEFYTKENFTVINTPKITTIGLESGAEAFAVSYFKKKAALAQSPQFYKQMFVMGGFERVMEIGPVFRAENSNTTRHQTEFVGVDFEMGFIKDEHDVMDMIENMMKSVLANVKKECSKELKMFDIDLTVPKKIPRIPMGELKEILAKQGKKLSKDDDLDAEAEKLAGEYVKKKYNEEFLFVTDYPYSVRPFYHMKPENDPQGTRSFDLLWNGVEVATGAQREHRLKVLEKQAKEKGLKVDPIYADIFRFGSIPHGGVGFGLDRLTQRILKLDNIREGLLLSRDPDRLTP